MDYMIFIARTVINQSINVFIFTSIHTKVSFCLSVSLSLSACLAAYVWLSVCLSLTRCTLVMVVLFVFLLAS